MPGSSVFAGESAAAAAFFPLRALAGVLGFAGLVAFVSFLGDGDLAFAVRPPPLFEVFAAAGAAFVSSAAFGFVGDVSVFLPLRVLAGVLALAKGGERGASRFT